MPEKLAFYARLAAEAFQAAAISQDPQERSRQRELGLRLIEQIRHREQGLDVEKVNLVERPRGSDQGEDGRGA